MQSIIVNYLRDVHSLHGCCIVSACVLPIIACVVLCDVQNSHVFATVCEMRALSPTVLRPLPDCLLLHKFVSGIYLASFWLLWMPSTAVLSKCLEC